MAPAASNWARDSTGSNFVVRSPRGVMRFQNVRGNRAGLDVWNTEICSEQGERETAACRLMNSPA